jgi:hypothetical protein
MERAEVLTKNIVLVTSSMEHAEVVTKNAVLTP